MMSLYNKTNVVKFNAMKMNNVTNSYLEIPQKIKMIMNNGTIIMYFTNLAILVFSVSTAMLSFVIVCVVVNKTCYFVIDAGLRPASHYSLHKRKTTIVDCGNCCFYREVLQTLKWNPLNVVVSNDWMFFIEKFSKQWNEMHWIWLF